MDYLVAHGNAAACSIFTPAEKDYLEVFNGTPATLTGSLITCEGGTQGTTYWTVDTRRSGDFDTYHGKPKECPIGNPIYPLSGSKGLREGLGSWSVGGQRVLVGYDTMLMVPNVDLVATFNAKPAASFGALWSSNLHKSLVFQVDWNITWQAIQASRGMGTWLSFVRQTNGTYSPDADVADRLVPVFGGWRYIDAAERSEESYDGSGKLLSVSYSNGSTLGYTYSDTGTPTSVAPAVGLLIAVQDQLGRSVQFQYEQPSGVSTPRIKQITDPAGQTIAVIYDGTGNLSQLNWPDGKNRQYLYERSDIPWALTGIVDENASRVATYGYDAQGRANDTQWAGGADHYGVSYISAPSRSVVVTYNSDGLWRDHYWNLPQGVSITKPNGSTSGVGVALVLGKPRLISQDQPAGSGCAASTSNATYDANGNVASEDDFNGTRVCYSSDPSRNLETTRVEGISNAQACATVIPAASTLPAGSRKVSTKWHGDWHLHTGVAEPGRLTTSVYNGQPDPFNGGATASCAPTSAVLPGGKPIAVLCKQVGQATTDADGSQGFNAALQAGVVNRETRWTYNQYGQVLTEDGPRTDVNDVTTYAYYSDTTAEHTLGDLRSITNAAGRVAQYTKYNKHGQLLESIDPNGVLSVNTYDLRQRLLSTSVGGQTTSYSYDPVGQLTRVTQPDASYIGYEYDDAHRQKAVFDNRGNRIEYTLDNTGTRIAENVKDPAGALRRTLSRSIDALGRVQQTTGRE